MRVHARTLPPLLLPALALALSLGLAACGESNEDRAVKAIEAEDRIIETIEHALVSTDPDACTEQMTQAFSEQGFRDEGVSSVESCEQNVRAEESPNDPVEVTEIEIDGAKATAEVALTDDGDATGQTLAVALVEEDGDWKLDEITGFAEFDRRRWIEEQREGFESGHNAIESQAVDCMIKAFREMSRPEIEEMVLGGSAQPEIEIYERCGAFEGQ
jgi:hypothetical protein